MIKILHVDGDPVYLQNVREKLSNLGPDLVIETAENYAEAIAKLEYAVYDVILTESRLPFSNGIDLIITIREKDRDIPIILLSSERGELLIKESLRAGASDFYTKDTLSPELDELYKAITTAVGLKNRRAKEQSLILARQAIAEETVLITDMEFFNSLLKYIALNLDVNFAFIGELSEDSKIIDTVSVWGFGHQVDGFSFPIIGTTSEEVIGKKTCVFPDNVIDKFPQDNTLAEMGIRSFIGCPLYDHSGNPIGVIAAMDNKPLARPEMARSLLTTLSTRASAELERLMTRRSIADFSEIQTGISRKATGTINHLAPHLRASAIEIIAPAYMDRLNNLLTESKSPAIKSILESAKKISRTNLSVLVTGEIGTCKELAAAFIHQNSYRSAHRFIKVECSKYNKLSFENELFGSRNSPLKNSGSSTSGLLEYANGGTVFLNNIHALERNLQERLIKFITTSTVEDKRSKPSQTSDIRIIAATNKSLGDLVNKDKFNENLYQELKSVVLEMPPLRDRLEDLPNFINFFLRKLREDNPDFPAKVSNGVVTAFANSRWPSNLRQLEATINFAASICDEEAININDIPQQVLVEKEWSDQDVPIVPLKELERRTILKTLDYFDGNKSKAARSLGISDRKLFYKLKEYEKNSK